MLLTIILRPLPPLPSAVIPVAPAPGDAGRPVSASPPPDVPAACAGDVRGTVFATGSLDDRVAAVRAWAPAHRGEPVSLVLGDAVVLASVRAVSFGPNAPPFRDPDVRIRPDGIHVSGSASVAIFRYAIAATLVPQVQDGRLRLVVAQLDTGGMPGFLRQQVSDLLARAADPGAWQLPVRVTAVALREGCGTIVGTAGGA